MVATDVVVFIMEGEELKVLLIKRSQNPFKNYWALPGGFLLADEPPQEAAARVLKDKAGVSQIYMEQLYTFPGSGLDPRGKMISVAYFALVPREKINIGLPRSGVQTPTFHSLKKLPKLAFAHRDMVAYALKRLRAKLEYTNAVYSLLPGQFTLNQLQKAYEIILDRRLDKRNFRKKFLLLGLISPTQKRLQGAHQRPARLYKFISRRPAMLKKFF